MRKATELMLQILYSTFYLVVLLVVIGAFVYLFLHRGDIDIPRPKNSRNVPKPGELVWFINPLHGPGSALGFVRNHSGGAFIYGGHTGSHFTGYSEKWDKKMAELRAQGYLSLRDARLAGWVPDNWQPPVDEAEKDDAVVKIREGIL